jgi:hypothetical protein
MDQEFADMQVFENSCKRQLFNLRVGFLVFPLYFTVREFPFAVFLCYYSSWVQVYNAANVS